MCAPVWCVKCSQCKECEHVVAERIEGMAAWNVRACGVREVVYEVQLENTCSEQQIDVGQGGLPGMCMPVCMR